MKRILYAILATVSGLVLLFSYRTSLGESVVSDVAAVSRNTTSVVPAPVASGASGTSTPAPTSSATATGSDAAASTGLSDGTFVGAAASTRYGDVQVQITVSGGTIVDVTVPEYPHENGKDVTINNRALPQLIAETTSAQSADVQMISGATYTSRGYVQSLQSALDQARA